MHINYRYLLKWADGIRRRNASASILDYGCGSGEVVNSGRLGGMDIYGVEVFLSESRRRDVEKLGYLGSIIKEIKNGKIPFPDSYFDLVMNNQVFEHVENMESVLCEISRVMKSGGVLVSHFPTREVFRECHIGIPCVHWFRKGSFVRYYYAYLLRAMGFGYYKDKRSCGQWTKDGMSYLDAQTHYRKKSEVLKLFSKYFRIETIEADYIQFRMRDSRTLRRISPLIKLPLFEDIAVCLYRKLGGMLLLATKE